MLPGSAGRAYQHPVRLLGSEGKYLLGKQGEYLWGTVRAISSKVGSSCTAPQLTVSQLAVSAQQAVLILMC